MERKISRYLLEEKLTLATAESCTGGLIAHRITNIDGSSRYFLGSIVAYANDVKMKSLFVKLKTIEDHGAVSAECVAEMALGVCNAIGADIGVSVSGIAGPGGGTEEKPVGLVYFGLHTPKGSWTSKQNFEGNREEIKQKAAEFGLSYLYKYLSGEFPIMSS